jgi:hypothetical protein
LILLQETFLDMNAPELITFFSSVWPSMQTWRAMRTRYRNSRISDMLVHISEHLHIRALSYIQIVCSGWSGCNFGITLYCYW